VNNMYKPRIGIVGAGTVGQALIAAFEGRAQLFVNDPKWGVASSPIAEMGASCEAIFVAVPTPSSAAGDADVAVLETVQVELGALCETSGVPAANLPVVCVKSTVPPDRVAEARRRWPDMRLVICPEFLREASPTEDMLNMVSLVLGGDAASCEVIVGLFRHHSHVVGPMRVSVLPDAVGAAFLKYQENAFLAMKVSFMNELFDMFHQSHSLTSWQQLQTAVHQDHERMGRTHWAVPGPDGLRGWGGSCWPKDVSALRQYAARLGVKTPLLDAVCERNFEDRQGAAIG
jgi:UDPglucose 6-dehydrogenase